MKKFLFVSLVILSFSLIGCGQKMEWRHNEHCDINRFNQDKAECEYEALKYGQTSIYGSDYISNIYASGQRQTQIFNGCMQVRGYYLVPVSE